MTVTTFLASDWYQSLMQLIPDGKLFSLRSVFDGIQGLSNNCLQP